MSQPLVTVVIPVYNEEEALPGSVSTLASFLKGHFANPVEIVIAENGSTDRTLEVAHNLRSRYQNLSILQLEQKGRGLAVREAWKRASGDILSYMAVDLSADLASFPRYNPTTHAPGYTGCELHSYDAMCHWHKATVAYWQISNCDFVTAAKQASADTMCPDPTPPMPRRDFQDDYNKALVDSGTGGTINFTPDNCLMIFGYGNLKLKDYNDWNSLGEPTPGSMVGTP
jgi:glycosyltransferase involved in cell wall biosynthesis